MWAIRNYLPVPKTRLVITISATCKVILVGERIRVEKISLQYL